MGGRSLPRRRSPGWPLRGSRLVSQPFRIAMLMCRLMAPLVVPMASATPVYVTVSSGLMPDRRRVTVSTTARTLSDAPLVAESEYICATRERTLS